MSEIAHEKQIYPALDGMRGMAAILVAIYHIYFESFGYKIIPRGYLAVDFFFLLSGFVIEISYGVSAKKEISIYEFLIKRLIRLYPMIFMGVTLDAILTNKFNPVDIILSLLVIPNLYSKFIFNVGGPIWSMFFEITYNLVFIFILTRTSSRLIIIVTLITFMLYIYCSSYRYNTDMGFTSSDFIAGFTRTFFSFSFGMLIARKKDFINIKINYLIAPIIFINCLTIPYIGQYNSLIDVITVLVGLPSALIFAISSTVTLKIRGMLSTLGKISYPLYLIHVPISHFAFNNGLNGELYNAILIAAIFLISLAVYQLYDFPIRRYLSSIIARRTEVLLYSR